MVHQAAALQCMSLSTRTYVACSLLQVLAVPGGGRGRVPMATISATAVHDLCSARVAHQALLRLGVDLLLAFLRPPDQGGLLQILNLSAMHNGGGYKGFLRSDNTRVSSLVAFAEHARCLRWAKSSAANFCVATCRPAAPCKGKKRLPSTCKRKSVFLALAMEHASSLHLRQHYSLDKLAYYDGLLVAAERPRFAQ